MATDFSRILDHPDCDNILSKILSGIPASDVADWLKLKYEKSEQSHLRLSVSLLNTLANNPAVSDLYNNTVKTDIEKVKSGKIDRALAASLKNNATYKERLAEVAGEEVDIVKTIKEVLLIIKTRAEQIFDKIQQNPEQTKGDYALIKYLETLLRTVEQYDKIVNNRPDQIIQHNVTVQMMGQYTTTFQDVIRRVLEKMDPEMACWFMDEMNKEMALLQPAEELSQDKRLKEAKLLATKVNDIAEI